MDKTFEEMFENSVLLEKEKEDENLLRELYNDGSPSNISIIAYYKYEFTIRAETTNYIFHIGCGGDADIIYRFDPFGGWEEWVNADADWFDIQEK